MYEYIFTRAALNEAISLRSVKPLDRPLFLHDYSFHIMQLDNFKNDKDKIP